jgi:hypothetical protein
LFEAALMPSAGTISREIALFLRLRTFHIPPAARHSAAGVDLCD